MRISFKENVAYRPYFRLTGHRTCHCKPLCFFIVSYDPMKSYIILEEEEEEEDDDDDDEEEEEEEEEEEGVWRKDIVIV